MDTTQDLESVVSNILEQLIVPIEITPYLTCFGQRYYQWRVRIKGLEGIAPTFSDAMQQALNASLTSSTKKRSA